MQKLWYEGKSKGNIDLELSDEDCINLVKVPVGKWKIVSVYDIRKKLKYRYSVKDIYKRLRKVKGIAVHTDYHGFPSLFSFEEKLSSRKREKMMK
jgi:hypothetical protein